MPVPRRAGRSYGSCWRGSAWQRAAAQQPFSGELPPRNAPPACSRTELFLSQRRSVLLPRFNVITFLEVRSEATENHPKLPLLVAPRLPGHSRHLPLCRPRCQFRAANRRHNPTHCTLYSSIAKAVTVLLAALQM